MNEVPAEFPVEQGQTATTRTWPDSERDDKSVRTRWFRGAASQGAARRLLLRALASRRVQLTGSFILLLIAVAILAPVISPHDPLQMNPPMRLRPPGPEYLLGTDEFGRDVLSRILWGARVSLGVGATSVALAAFGGVTLGVLAGYFGGLVDTVIMRLLDVLLSVPPILLAIAMAGFAGHSSVILVLVLGLLYVPRFGRVIYGSVQSVKQNPYVEASRAIGATHLHIILEHILPNIFALIVIQITLNIGFLILLEAGLSFLGLGTVPPTPSWGTMIAAARDYMEQAPFLVIWPSLAVALTVLSFNVLGDGLRDALDPRLRDV